MTEGVYDGSTLFTVIDIEGSLQGLKIGESSGIDDLCKENIICAHPPVIVYLKILFNTLCTHGFVPDAFGQGVTISVIKDRLGDSSSVSDYRPITPRPVISKIFEYCVVHKFEHLFYTESIAVWFSERFVLF